MAWQREHKQAQPVYQRGKGAMGIFRGEFRDEVPDSKT